MRARWSLACVAIMFAGCPGPTNAPVLAPSDLRLLEWFAGCLECDQATDSIRALAVRHPEFTVDTLNVLLLNGPSPERISHAVSQLTRAFLTESTYRARVGMPALGDRAVWVAGERTRFVEGRQVRGALGLGWIHSPRAVGYLDSAATLPLPPGVKAAVVYARDSLPQ